MMHSPPFPAVGVVDDRNFKIEPDSFKKAALVLRAVNHPLRQRLLRLLHQQGTLRVTQIYQKLQLEQSVASQHLGILRRAGLVVTKREGKQIYYSVNYERFHEVHQHARALLN